MNMYESRTGIKRGLNDKNLQKRAYGESQASSEKRRLDTLRIN
jgi:hypothetical protein